MKIQKFQPLFYLTLTLLVFAIDFAKNVNPALSLGDVAMWTELLHGCPDFVVSDTLKRHVVSWTNHLRTRII